MHRTSTAETVHFSSGCFHKWNYKVSEAGNNQKRTTTIVNRLMKVKQKRIGCLLSCHSHLYPERTCLNVVLLWQDLLVQMWRLGSPKLVCNFAKAWLPYVLTTGWDTLDIVVALLSHYHLNAEYSGASWDAPGQKFDTLEVDWICEFWWLQGIVVANEG